MLIINRLKEITTGRGARKDDDEIVVSRLILRRNLSDSRNKSGSLPRLFTFGD